VALTLGYAIDTETSVSASSVLNTIYQTKVDYEELKVLVLGLFSRKPNNLFEGHYAELRDDVLEKLYDQTRGDEAVFSVLLLLLKESRVALKLCEKTYSGEEYAQLFRRFYTDDKPRYRVYFAIGKPESEIARDVFAKISSTAFSSLYKKVLMRMDAEKPRSQPST
jgi:hypothetical protein